jgi:hypothetical protein
MRKYRLLSSKSKDFITITCIHVQSSYSNSNIGSIFFDHMDHHKRPFLDTNSLTGIGQAYATRKIIPLIVRHATRKIKTI